MEFKGYCIRIDARDGYKDKIQALVMTDDYDAIIGARHNGRKGENPHYHLVIQTQVKDQAMRVRLRKIFDQGKGNAHMSMKPWDGDLKGISYLFHEEGEDIHDATIVVRKNISDETIDKARTLNKEIQEKVKSAKEKASWKLEQELYEHYKRTKQHPSEWTIAKDLVLLSLRSDKYVPNDFLLRAMATKIAFKLLDGKEDEEEALAKLMVAKVYRMDDDAIRYWTQSSSGGV